MIMNTLSQEQEGREGGGEGERDGETHDAPSVLLDSFYAYSHFLPPSLPPSLPPLAIQAAREREGDVDGSTQEREGEEIQAGKKRRAGRREGGREGGVGELVTG